MTQKKFVKSIFEDLWVRFLYDYEQSTIQILKADPNPARADYGKVLRQMMKEVKYSKNRCKEFYDWLRQNYGVEAKKND